VDQHSTATHTTVPRALQGVEAALRRLGEKARHVGELIAQVRAEKADLQLKVEQLEGELTQLKEQLAIKEELVKTMSEKQNLAEAAGRGIMVDGDREALSAKVKELLARIDGYL
jgi:predicted  nucleic acid-binding Zn-ribbon protein